MVAQSDWLPMMIATGFVVIGCPDARLPRFVAPQEKLNL
jgi:hypothetical protein